MMVISGEPLIFIEVALLKDVAKSIQVNFFDTLSCLFKTFNQLTFITWWNPGGLMG